MKPPPCFLCGEKYATESHFWRKHFEIYSLQPRWKSCWCGILLLESDSIIHLDIRGGAQAHWLAVQLGI